MTPRRLVAIASAVGLTAAVATALVSSPLWLVLIAFFFALLCLFHLILATWTTITKRIVRGTDYIYFSLAAAGLFLAFLAQDRTPSHYYLAVATLTQPRETKQVRENIAVLRKFCESNPQLAPGYPTSIFLQFLLPKPDDDACLFLTIADTIVQNGEYALVPPLINAYEARHTRSELLVLSPQKNLSSMIFWIVRLQLEAQYYKHVVTAQQQPISKGISEPIVLLTDYFLKTLWPFVLAIALAIRITRVTADVTEWPA